MIGVGPQEAIILLVIVLLVFGTPVLAFLLGYTMGRSSASARTRDVTANTEDGESKELSE